MTPLLRKLFPVFVLLLVWAASPPQRAASETTGLDWRACGSFQCATMSVPLDYADPDGRQIQLSVVRQLARNPGSRIGSLFVNPGGPGGSAIEFLRAWAPTLSTEIRNRFDVITFDPRGVGESTPVVCHDDIIKLVSLPPDPKNDEQWQEVADADKAFADLCGQRSDGTLAYLGTVNVARDIDRLREALGEDRISYFGYSYGTELGAVYADLFPDRVRAMVLDGAVDLSLSGDQADLEQALAFETAYDHFLQDCRARSCLDAPGDPADVIQGLLDKADQAPIPTPRYGRPASQGELVLAIVGSMYSQGTWTSLARGVDQAVDGDATNLLRIADNYLGRNADGSYDNSLEMNIAVNCLDHAYTTDLTAVKALADQFEAQAPRFGAALAQGGLTCGFWQAKPSPPAVPRASGAPPIVVIGTTSDPATPYRWAVAVSQQLESGVLLTRHGEGHTAYRAGNSCIDIAVNDYLVSVEPPATGTECGTERFEPPPLEHPQLAAPPQPTTASQAQAPGSTPDAAQPSAAAAPVEQGRTNVVRLAGALVLVLLLAGGALWAVRRT